MAKMISKCFMAVWVLVVGQVKLFVQEACNPVFRIANPMPLLPVDSQAFPGTTPGITQGAGDAVDLIVLDGDIVSAHSAVWEGDGIVDPQGVWLWEDLCGVTASPLSKTPVRIESVVVRAVPPEVTL